jgi:murein DD-endopeptidase MepM/ murein hydrolase activator NlpD
MKKGFILIISSLLVSVILIAFLLAETASRIEMMALPAEEEAELMQVDKKEPVIKYGMDMDSLDVFDYKVERNQTLSDIFTAHNISPDTIHKIFEKSKPVFDLSKIQTGKNYKIYLAKDFAMSLKAFVYEANPIDHIVVKLDDSVQIFREEKNVDTTIRSIGAELTASLYENLQHLNTAPDLPVNLARIFAWQVDFFKITEKDNFKVVYEEISVDGKPVKSGRILAASFQQNGKTHYAINFAEDGEEKYFNEEGKNVKGAFLKSPLKFFRITSRFAKKRFHPVLKRYKAHLGTDYAAPYGTPILTVGNGVVLEAKYSQFNGNYVKIKHNSTYTTQYLHMSKIARGMRPGRRVRQGEVIGYVGSTGLATGPHVCFRFWKNGVQSDPRGVKIMESDPVKKSNKEAFEKVKAQMMAKLDSVAFGG